MDLYNKKFLKNVNEHWSKYRAIFTTATITIGVSFDKPHFNKTFIIGYPSCMARDLFQSHQRVRTLSNNEIIFTLPKKSSYNYVYGMSHYYLQFYLNFDNEVESNYKLQIDLLQTLKDKINNTTNPYNKKYNPDNIKKNCRI